jgi:aspartyl-tRNA(Asn)/glutamyl-tRNA(Gln) amidotransferase subunit B
MPFAKKGFMEIETDSGAKKIGITRIHLEEDTGKSVHKGTIDKSEYTYLDYNRSGIPLMEIVTEPDIASAKEASVFLNKLRKILLWIGVSDCKMEEGSLRCDANVSVSADLKLNTKVEIKNMNSFRSVQKALEFEIKRQTECYKKGENIIQETRGWDEEKEITISMRSKEEAHDYRYFFEPDLTQVTVNTETVNELKNKLPELPDYMKKRFVESYGLKINQAEVLTSQRSLADFFERTLKMTGQPEQTANWLCQDILGYLNKNNLKLSQTKLTPDILSRLIQFVNEKKISSGQGKMLLADCFEGKDPEILIKEKNMILINGKDELLSLIKTVINENTEVVSDLKKGEEKKLMFLIGQIMKKTSGKADPKSAKEILLKEIEKT